jgi:hypothetical protein
VASDLVEIVVTLLRKRHVALLVVDDAEAMRPAGLTVLRDVMSRAQVAGQTGAASADHGAEGIGIVLLGGPKFVVQWPAVRETCAPRKRVAEAAPLAGDAGGRMARLVEVPPLSAAEVAAIHLRMFPRFASGLAAVGGEAAWPAWLQSNVTRGQPRALRVLFNHGLEYVRLMLRLEYRAAAAERRPLRFATVAETPFAPAVFLAAWRRLQRDAAAAAGERGPSWYEAGLPEGGA